MRSHVMVDGSVGLRSLETILKVRDEYRDLIDIQLVAFPQSGILGSPGTPQLLDDAIGLGADVVGGLDPASFDRDVEGISTSSLASRKSMALMSTFICMMPACLAPSRSSRLRARTRSLGMEGHVASGHATHSAIFRVDILRGPPRLARSMSRSTNAPGAAFPPVALLTATWPHAERARPRRNLLDREGAKHAGIMQMNVDINAMLLRDAKTTSRCPSTSRSKLAGSSRRPHPRRARCVVTAIAVCRTAGIPLLWERPRGMSIRSLYSSRTFRMVSSDLSPRSLHHHRGCALPRAMPDAKVERFRARTSIGGRREVLRLKCHLSWTLNRSTHGLCGRQRRRKAGIPDGYGPRRSADDQRLIESTISTPQGGVGAFGARRSGRADQHVFAGAVGEPCIDESCRRICSVLLIDCDPHGRRVRSGMPA